MSDPSAQGYPPAGAPPTPGAGMAPGYPPAGVPQEYPQAGIAPGYPAAAPAAGAWSPPPVAGPAAPPPIGPWNAGAPAWSAGAQAAVVQPGFLSRLDPRGWRTTILVAIIMIAVVGGANLLNSVVAMPAGTTGENGQPTVPVTAGDPIPVRDGVVFYGPSGWSMVQQKDGSVVLAKGSGVIAVEAQPFDGSPADLEAAYRKATLKETDPTSEPKQITFGNQIPGLLVVFHTNDSKAGPLDGIYVVGVQNGMAAVMAVLAPQGDLATYSDDADQVLNSIRIGG